MTNNANTTWADFTSGGAYLRARDYQLGDRVKALFTEFQGFKPVQGQDKEVPNYLVEVSGAEKVFSLNATNGAALSKMGIKDFEDLVGYEVEFVVGRTNIAPSAKNPNSLGLQVINAKRNAPRKAGNKQPRQEEVEEE